MSTSFPFGQPPKRTKPKEIQTKSVGVIFLYWFLRLSARVFAAGFVAICCKRENLQDSASRGVRPIALVVREQIGKRWTRITRIRRQPGAEKQVLTTPYLFCPTHANAGKVTARDEIERGLG